jgi:hypothetical protein
LDPLTCPARKCDDVLQHAIRVRIGKAVGGILVHNQPAACDENPGRFRPPKFLIPTGTEIRGASKGMISYTEPDEKWGQVTFQFESTKENVRDVLEREVYLAESRREMLAAA